MENSHFKPPFNDQKQTYSLYWKRIQTSWITRRKLKILYSKQLILMTYQRWSKLFLQMRMVIQRKREIVLPTRTWIRFQIRLETRCRTSRPTANNSQSLITVKRVLRPLLVETSSRQRNRTNRGFNERLGSFLARIKITSIQIKSLGLGDPGVWELALQAISVPTAYQMQLGMCHLDEVSKTVRNYS